MIQPIQWITQGVEMPAIDRNLITRWIDAVAASYGRITGPLTYIFCNDDRIIEVNREFIDHDYYTDIITFDYCRGRMISGDIFISLDTVASNAELFSTGYDRELHRVIIHGILHLCGLHDKAPGERETMEAAENAALATLDKMKETDTNEI